MEKKELICNLYSAIQSKDVNNVLSFYSTDFLYENNFWTSVDLTDYEKVINYVFSHLIEFQCYFNIVKDDNFMVNWTIEFKKKKKTHHLEFFSTFEIKNNKIIKQRDNFDIPWLLSNVGSFFGKLFNNSKWYHEKYKNKLWETITESK